MKDVAKIIEVSLDVGRIKFYSMASQVTEGDHLPELN